MSRYRAGYRGDRYRGFTGTDGLGIPGMAVSMFLGIGLALALGFTSIKWPMAWSMAVMSGALLLGGGLALVCRWLDWPLLAFFEVFAGMLLVFWSLTSGAVLLGVTFWGRGRLRGISIALGVLAAALVFWRDKKRREKPSILFALYFGLIIFSCAHNGLLSLNILVDHRPETRTAAQVLRVEKERRETFSRFGSRTYTLYYAVVKENELTRGGTWLRVERETYEALEPGDQVELILHPGALGDPWLECVEDSR